MANPSIENGYIRISNELWEEILRRDFSKRQRAIIDFIWRLSYGTRKPYAIITQLKDFELAGIGKTHITKELKHLEACRVLTWDRQLNRFEITEDYERWQINPHREWDKEKFDDILHANIRESVSYQNSNLVTKTVTELPKQEPNEEGESYQNSNSSVTKTVTEEGDEPYSPKASEASKDSIKDSNNKKENKEEQPRDFTAFKIDKKHTQEITELLVKNHFGFPGSIVLSDINYWIESGAFDEPHEIIKEAIKEAARSDANKWRYVDTVLQDWQRQNIKTGAEAVAYTKKRQHDQQQQREAREQKLNQPQPYRAGYNNRQPVRTEQRPAWLDEHEKDEQRRRAQQEQQGEQGLSPEELEARKRKIEERIKNLKAK